MRIGEREDTFIFVTKELSCFETSSSTLCICISCVSSIILQLRVGGEGREGKGEERRKGEGEEKILSPLTTSWSNHQPPSALPSRG